MHVFLPVVLIMLLGVALAAAKMFGVLLDEGMALLVGVPTVFTAKLPGGGFFTGTTTLLQMNTFSYIRTFGVGSVSTADTVVIKKYFRCYNVRNLSQTKADHEEHQ